MAVKITPPPTKGMERATRKPLLPLTRGHNITSASRRTIATRPASTIRRAWTQPDVTADDVVVPHGVIKRQVHGHGDAHENRELIGPWMPIGGSAGNQGVTESEEQVVDRDDDDDVHSQVQYPATPQTVWKTGCAARPIYSWLRVRQAGCFRDLLVVSRSTHENRPPS